MTPKERAAMQQALEALLRSIPDELLMISGPEEADAFHREAITVLREALANSLKPKCFADYQPNHAIDRVCASCAVAVECQTGEQAEQEPMYISKDCVERGCACHYSVEVDGEPVAVYSAPVRTKDLTDDEIYPLYPEGPMCDKDMIDFARAVIAADRELNK